MICLMGTLYRFEDYNGMFNVFCGINKIELETTEICGIFRVVGDKYNNVFVEYGLGIPEVFQFTDVLQQAVAVLGLTRIVIVFDLDSSKNIQGELIETSLLRRVYKHDIGDMYGLGIEVYCIPVVYCAESILLFSIQDRYSVKTREVFNKYQCNRMPLAILSVYLSMQPSEVKSFKKSLDISSLRLNLHMNKESVADDICLRWIANDCSVEHEITIEDGFRYIESVRNYYRELVSGYKLSVVFNDSVLFTSNEQLTDKETVSRFISEIDNAINEPTKNMMLKLSVMKQ